MVICIVDSRVVVIVEKRLRRIPVRPEVFSGWLVSVTISDMQESGTVAPLGFTVAPLGLTVPFGTSMYIPHILRHHCSMTSIITLIHSYRLSLATASSLSFRLLEFTHLATYQKSATSR